MHEHNISVVFGIIATFISYCFGINEHLEYLLWCITLDIVLGVLASFVNPRLMFNSRKMCRGIVKKVVILTLVAFAHQLDLMLHTDGIVATTVTYYFICNEGLSCLENSAKCGVKYPAILRNSLEQLKGLSKK